MAATERQFYGVCIKPYANGKSRWLVYELMLDDLGYPKLSKLWPQHPDDHKKSVKNGFSHSNNLNYPSYHFFISEIGTSHHYLLKAAISYVLHKDQGQEMANPNDIKLEIL